MTCTCETTAAALSAYDGCVAAPVDAALDCPQHGAQRSPSALLTLAAKLHEIAAISDQLNTPSFPVVEYDVQRLDETGVTTDVVELTSTELRAAADALRLLSGMVTS